MDFWGIEHYYEKISVDKASRHICESCKIKTDVQLPFCQENSECLKLNLRFLLGENLKYKKELEKYKN